MRLDLPLILLAVALGVGACNVSPPPPPKDGISILPNGLKMKQTTLPSGKRISLMLGADNSLVEEIHMHPGPTGKTAILLKKSFDHGKKTGETYIFNGRVASREVYEQERVRYADMPAADSSVIDRGTEGLRKSEEDLRRRQVEGKRRASLSQAEQLDLACEDAMHDGENRDVAEWRKTGRAIVLGELDAKTSGAIVDDLFAAGAVRIVATNVGNPESELDPSWIVVEAPKDPARRKALFAVFDRLASKDGWDPTPDVGQKYQLLGKFKWMPWTRWP